MLLPRVESVAETVYNHGSYNPCEILKKKNCMYISWKCIMKLAYYPCKNICIISLTLVKKNSPSATVLSNPLCLCHVPFHCVPQSCHGECLSEPVLEFLSSSMLLSTAHPNESPSLFCTMEMVAFGIGSPALFTALILTDPFLIMLSLCS